MNRRIPVVAAAVAALAVGAAGAACATRDDAPPAASAPRSTTSTSTTAPTTEAVDGAPGGPGAGDPYFPELGNTGYDVQHYDLDLDWRADAGALDGVVTIKADATQDLNRYDLDLLGMDVRRVSVDGVPAKVARHGRELVLTPATAIPKGAAFTTVVTYSGVPKPISQGTEIFKVGWQTRGREAYVVSEPSGAATFFPVNDHPSDKATYTLHVTAPEDQVVVANGLLVGKDDVGHGSRAWTYEERAPMASYLVQIAIGDYELVDAGKAGKVVLRNAFHRGIGEERVAVAHTADMIELLTDVYGPFPFEAYGVVAVDEDLGFALETQTLTIVGADILAQGRGAEQALLHELAHQWVGDAVSPATWKDVWLNEGFATYSEWLWLERTGVSTAAEEARRYEVDKGDRLDVPPGDPGSEELFSATVYLRGGMTLQALREQVGDDVFFQILRRWVSEHHGEVASTADFIALAEGASHQQLDDLFQRWLYDDTLPSLG